MLKTHKIGITILFVTKEVIILAIRHTKEVIPRFLQTW